MDEIEENDFNLNISRYVSTAKPEPQIDIGGVHDELEPAEEDILKAKSAHNKYLQELGLKPLARRRRNVRGERKS